MTKLEAYIMRFITLCRKVKEYYNRVIKIWVVIVGCFCFGILFWVITPATELPLLSFIFFALGVVVLFLKLRGFKL